MRDACDRLEPAAEQVSAFTFPADRTASQDQAVANSSAVRSSVDELVKGEVDARGALRVSLKHPACRLQEDGQANKAWHVQVPQACRVVGCEEGSESWL